MGGAAYNVAMGSGYSGYDEDRQRMIAETSAFVTWGLRHPGEVRWIPCRPVAEKLAFSPRLRAAFWLGQFVKRQP
jgi:hypothetical protein